MSSSEDITREFKEILEKGIYYLRNIEELIDIRTEFLNNVKKSLDIIEKMVDEQFPKVIEDIVPPISSKISKHLEKIKPKVTKLSDAQNLIADIVNQLKTDVKIFSVKDLYKKIDELEKIDFSQPLTTRPVISQVIETPSPRTEKAVQKETIPPLHAPIPSISVKTSVAPSEEKVPVGDWRESELEGSKIFDELITGWKRRDWEKIGGTKEMFMYGWAKLSSYDRKKIRSGTWSKPIMNKLKLLGREKKV
ncbi:MAG: hypothetical protein ACFFDN_26120 [Candidatus Hodarchaeota archaeon]